MAKIENKKNATILVCPVCESWNCKQALFVLETKRRWGAGKGENKDSAKKKKGKSLKTLAQCCYDKILVVRLTMLVSIPSKGLPLPWLSSSTNKYLVPAVSLAAKMRLKSITPSPTLHTSSLYTL